MNQLTTNPLSRAIVFGACLAGLEPSAWAESAHAATTKPKEAQATAGATGAELRMPSFRPVGLSKEASTSLSDVPELKELIASVEPRLRGEKVVFALVDKEGRVVEGRELSFPKEEQENTKLLWGLFTSGLLASATLSGLTIGLFSISKLQLTLLAEQGNEDAKKILGLREDANTVLSTLIWGNVGLNVLISKVGDQAVSDIFGPAGAVLFSIGAITLFGEILPQAYFTQNVLKAGARLEPVVKALRVLLYPVAKPSGLIMDKLVGREGLDFLKEKDLKALLDLSARGNPEETSAVEARGAINFLGLDDLSVCEEGEVLSERSIVYLPLNGKGGLEIPEYTPSKHDSFLKRIQEGDQKWVVFCDMDGNPIKVLDADSFLRDVLFEPEYTPPHSYWHKPIVVRSEDKKLGEILPQLSVDPVHPEDDVIDRDIILVWTDREKRIITGSDLLGRLMRGIARRNPVSGEGEVTSA